jgi:CspA family cold shock protein
LSAYNKNKRETNNMSTLKGKVKWFNGTKGYGFIEREDKEKDVFVHSSAITEAGLGSLNEGDELTFEVENGDKGPSAVKLQKA